MSNNKNIAKQSSFLSEASQFIQFDDNEQKSVISSFDSSLNLPVLPQSNDPHNDTKIASRKFTDSMEDNSSEWTTSPTNSSVDFFESISDQIRQDKRFWLYPLAIFSAIILITSGLTYNFYLNSQKAFYALKNSYKIQEDNLRKQLNELTKKRQAELAALAFNKAMREQKEKAEAEKKSITNQQTSTPVSSGVINNNKEKKPKAKKATPTKRPKSILQSECINSDDPLCGI